MGTQPGCDDRQSGVAGDQGQHERLALIGACPQVVSVERQEDLGGQPRQPLVAVDERLIVVDRLA
jgi:hypothetical protein